MALVWGSVFRATTAAPQIEWREDRCPTAPRNGPAAVIEEGYCYAGLYLRDDRALIAWRGSYHESAFAHELMHAWQWARGVDDPDHTRAVDWASAAEAGQQLADAGF